MTLLLSLLALVATPARAKCAEWVRYEVVGAVEPGIDELCVFVGASGTCIDHEGGPFTVTVQADVTPSGRLLYDRCTLDNDTVTLVTRQGDTARQQTYRIRERSVDYTADPNRIDLHPKK